MYFLCLSVISLYEVFAGVHLCNVFRWLSFSIMCQLYLFVLNRPLCWFFRLVLSSYVSESYGNDTTRRPNTSNTVRFLNIWILYDPTEVSWCSDFSGGCNWDPLGPVQLLRWAFGSWLCLWESLAPKLQRRNDRVRQRFHQILDVIAFIIGKLSFPGFA